MAERSGSRLTFIKNIKNSIKSLYQCSCGSIKEISTAHVDGGRTRSCGCLRLEAVSKMLTIHGCSKKGKESEEYRTWKSIKTRCGNKKVKSYKHYGGRGISVCERWASSFENFYKDMGPRPSGYTIERLDNDKGYGPDNCVWASHKDQAKNRRNNRFITIEGRTKILSEWCSELGIDYSKVHKRIVYSKWSPQEALELKKR